jgi:hypothetical protein
MIGRLTLVALLAGAVLASPAAAQSRCTAPETPGWHSCLAALHRTTADGAQIHLTSVRPRLAMRYEGGCPEGRRQRAVTVRTGAGERLGRATARTRCKRGVARWEVKLELEVDLPKGTVVRSFWTGTADNVEAPRVKLNGAS